MPSTPDIRNWNDIDAPWLTAVLKQDGIDAEVATFTKAKVGTGQVGDCVRFVLDYAGTPPDNAPKTMVGKFQSESPDSRATGIQLLNYYREVRFYQLLQDKARITTPYCYFTDMIEETHEFVLMMGDLAPAEQGDQLQGVGLDQTRQVLTEAAKLHSAFWQDDSLDQYHWVGGTSQAESVISPELLAAVWTGFEERYGDRVSPDASRIGAGIGRNYARWEERTSGPKGLMHSDFRPDNMMFDTTGAQAPVTVVDWQSFNYGGCAADAGYFIAGAVAPDLRREHEDALQAHYLAAFEAETGEAYPQDVFQRHYIMGAYQLFLTAYFAAMMVKQTDRGDDMFFKMLNGAVDLVIDRDASDWFD